MSHLATEDPIVPTEAAPLIGPTSATSSRRGSDAGSALELGSLHCSTSSTSTTPGPQNQRTNTPQPASPTSTVAPSASKSTSPPSSATQSRKTWPRLIHAFRWWWWWEVGAALLSTTCILLIFATLMTMHEQPLSDWKLAISINATVSILTTVAKSALMLLVAESISHLKWLHYESTQCLKDVQAFDEASRGPWGATMFVLGARGRSLLATIASVIVVVSLGFEPAAQQMLSFPSRSVALKSSAGAYVYQALALNTTDLVEIHPSTAAGYDPPNSLQVALINSFAGIVSDAPHDCQTSLCQFGDIETLGVCEQCRDATHQVHHIRNYTGSGGDEDADGEPSYKDYHDYFIANDPYYPVVQINYTNHGAIDGNNGFAISGNYTWSMDDLSNRRAGFTAINMSDLNSDTVESTTICDFSWCVRKYFAAEITNGQFHFEKESRSFLNITNSTGSGVYNMDTTFILGSPQPGFGRQYKVDQMVDYVLWEYLTKALSGDSSSNTLRDLCPWPLQIGCGA
ncbi:uncharacterized protein K441DRAFT_697052 [Cenococcum geophilum 1.58]|uniref:uncharacterized protein n=1 Tax=Cenococcum geophilum 1.58 TaxID=794803 RepID=UPI00358F0B73|nr:hypothetical protein K441DRAFT_697052 [Cenococcum geophilum 1.58]